MKAFIVFDHVSSKWRCPRERSNKILSEEINIAKDKGSMFHTVKNIINHNGTKVINGKTESNQTAR